MNAGRWRRWRHGGRRDGRACRRSRAACRRYPSAADRNYQGGNTTEQRELGPGLSFHLTSLSQYRVFCHHPWHASDTIPPYGMCQEQLVDLYEQIGHKISELPIRLVNQ
jgi:hypothetical protein